MLPDPNPVAPIITGAATLIGAIVGAITATLVPYLSNRFIKHFNEKRSRGIFSEELVDLIRHCGSNLDILYRIDGRLGTPARMHLDKLMMYETPLIFDNDIVRDLPIGIRNRCIWIRINVRNINKEIQDVIDYCYGKTLRSPSEINQRLKYIKDKLVYAQDRMKYELSSINGQNQLKKPESRKDILYVSAPYE